MDPKWRLVLALLTAWTSVNLASAKSTCTVPSNAVQITADQMKGVWTVPIIVNFDDFYANYSCLRVEHNFSNLTDGLGYYSAFDQGNGKFASFLMYIAILNNQLFHFTLSSNPSVIFTYDILLINDKAYVASGCYYNGDVSEQPYTIVVTRSLTTTEAEANDLLKQAGVTVKKSFVFNNAGSCYKLKSC